MGYRESGPFTAPPLSKTVAARSGLEFARRGPRRADL